MLKLNRYLIIISLSVAFACTSPEVNHYAIEEPDHQKEISSWYSDRINSLKSENGWLNLVGLHWFEEDTLQASELDIPDFPMMGIWYTSAGKVYFEPALENVKIGDEVINNQVLIFDQELELASTLAYEDFRVTPLQRGDLIGLRVRDLSAIQVQEFTGIERFPVSLDWRIVADFVPYNPVREIPISNVLGHTYPAKTLGYLTFEYEGKRYQLDALEEGDQLFLIFSDGTSGAETYGGGRYLYVNKADPFGKVIVDFNKAFNPPCVFTPFATCPLPPRQNILTLAIEAGEKYWEKVMD